MKNFINRIIFLVTLVLGPVLMTMAQPGPVNPTPIPDPTFGPGGPISCSVPVGNGYWIMMALAVGYGVYRIWQMRKAEKLA